MLTKSRTNLKYRYPLRPCFAIVSLLLILSFPVHAQQTEQLGHSLVSIKDFGDFIGTLFHKKKDSTKVKTPPTFALLPSIGYNPSLGFVIGAKVSAVKKFGNSDSTGLSSFGLEAIYSSRGIITAQARHNIFTTANRLNFQGNWQLSKFLITDYNIGTGNKNYLNGSDSAFLVKYLFIRLSEKVYRKIGKKFFVGGGISFDIRTNIDDRKLDSLKSTPHYRYSQRNGYNPRKYSANGLLLAFQYNSREHPIRSYGGLYADLTLRFNQKWLGSSKNAVQLQYDLRKYFSLSHRNPEHVLALWHWASYKLGGSLPYLELPATGYDTYNRSGRGYTIGRFKGPNFAYFETEYRFPILRNKLLSGVAFFNLQSASDDLGKKIFQFLDPSGGGGLRILLQKDSRSTICIDYAIGKYGAKGFFFGLNEVF